MLPQTSLPQGSLLDKDTDSLKTPNATREVLSMDVDSSNAVNSEYRVLFGDQVKYIVVVAGTYDSEILSFPPDFLDHLPNLPLGDWTRVRIFRLDGKVSFELFNQKLAGVRSLWHSNLVDFQSLTFNERIDTRVRGGLYGLKPAVLKIARFEFEIPQVDTETAIYQAIDGRRIGPAFLGHVIEHGRVIGFLIERVEGRRAHIEDLEACQEITKRLHSLGIVHGDLNRHNYIVSASDVTLIDFENATLNGNKEEMKKEYDQIAEQLLEETGRGAECSDSE